VNEHVYAGTVAALVSVLVSMLSPWVSAKIKARNRVRIEQATVQVRRMDGQAQFYADLQRRLADVERERDAGYRKNRSLDSRMVGLEARFLSLQNDVEELRFMIVDLGEHPQAAAFMEIALRIEDKIRRREHATGTEGAV